MADIPDEAVDAVTYEYDEDVSRESPGAYANVMSDGILNRAHQKGVEVTVTSNAHDEIRADERQRVLDYLFNNFDDHDPAERDEEGRLWGLESFTFNRPTLDAIAANDEPKVVLSIAEWEKLVENDEQAIRADERQRVAEEILAESHTVCWSDRADGDLLSDGMDMAARIAERGGK